MNHKPKPRCPKCKGTMKRSGAQFNASFTCKKCGHRIKVGVGWTTLKGED